MGAVQNISRVSWRPLGAAFKCISESVTLIEMSPKFMQNSTFPHSEQHSEHQQPPKAAATSSLLMQDQPWAYRLPILGSSLSWPLGWFLSLFPGKLFNTSELGCFPDNIPYPCVSQAVCVPTVYISQCENTHTHIFSKCDHKP